jgi:hypothetical protein
MLCQKNNDIILSAKSKNLHEYGFSLLINTPGLYTLKGAVIEVYESAVNRNEGEDVLLAGLPLVLRPGLKDELKRYPGTIPKDVIVIADPLGLAAFVTQGGLVRYKDRAEPAQGSDKLYAVKIGRSIGGI